VTNYTSKSFDNTNKGILWNIPVSADGQKEMALIKQGKLNFEGEQRRIYGVSRKNKDGEIIMSILCEIGTLKINPEGKPNLVATDEARPPDSKGVVQNLELKGSYKISSWKKTSEGGNKFSNLQIQKFDDEDKPSQQYNEGDSFDEIPI